MRIVPTELVARYEQEGWWTQETIGDLLTRGLAAAPQTRFRIHSATRPWSGTFADVESAARRLAAGLRGRGVGPGDVIAFQLPNWVEAAEVFWAAAFLGATVVPIVHFYGRRELDFIVAETSPQAFIGAEGFGVAGAHPDLFADVPVVGLVGRDFADLYADEPLAGTLPVSPAAPALIAFTSGTTSSPKGVIHTHQTLGHETRQLSWLYPPDRGHQLTGAPVGHFIGMINAFLIPVLDGTPVNLIDQWDPGTVLALLRSEDLTAGGGATYFVTSLLDHPDFTPAHLPHLKYAGLGGSSVPAAVTRRLAGLGIIVFRSYGSTEHPSITGSQYLAPEAKRLLTDGDALPGVEIRLAEDGEILSRGPDLCLGYTDDALTRRAFDDDGWYHTGDIGTLDEDDYLTITDRKSDVIIRGGENISALEVEEVLLTMPPVAEAAVVSAPDARLGEHVAAVLRLRTGQPMPTIADVRVHFADAGLAKQKWPEELHQVEDFPRTASGKVQKFLVRKELVTQSIATV